MAKGTKFGGLHSSADLQLIQQKIEIGSPAPKTVLVEIPGANGSKDLTEALGVGVAFGDRTLKWTFALYPGADWAQKRSAVCNAMNGKRMHITPDGEEGWYYDGRITVADHKSEKLLRQITVSAVCAPYRLKSTETAVSDENLGTEFTELSCAVGAMPLVPTIIVAQETVLQWGDYSAAIPAGESLIPALRMSGNQVIKAKVASGTGSITIKWREGSL